eukprot:gnl/TRDRNA2_/TRDRNA2_82068_c0_seq1.p1 gnl/TRDRNA2_/TRDRNA2_82068_c0~~gnl/TRDRNA2_/TRDRNA2_82068_c0_seq1.p1  ORF type:complete len:365 (+),score=55.76 gnl/TRDRNA2_/TRDRNA2_82068_c0_seq1:42-1097(+)
MYAITAADPCSLPRVIEKVMGSYFSKRKMFMDLNYPRTSYFTGKYLNLILQRTFARRRLEDMLVPIMFTSTDILNFEAKVHHEGPLWRIIRASCSLVGFVPPLPHQENRAEDGKVCSSLLVDGGYTNMYPVGDVRQRGAGIVFCVQACPGFDPVSTDYGDRVLGGTISLLRLLRIPWRWFKGPDPPDLSEIQERLMFLPDELKGKAKAADHRPDLFLRPSIAGYGLLEFDRFRELEQVGYEHALPNLREWLEGDTPAADFIRGLIGQQNEADMPDRRPSSHMSADVDGYGGRQRYSLWRQSMRKAETAPTGIAGVLTKQTGEAKLQHSPGKRQQPFAAVTAADSDSAFESD